MHVCESWIIIKTAEGHMLTTCQALCCEPYTDFLIRSSQQFKVIATFRVPILGMRKLRFRPNITQFINGKTKIHTRSV